MPVAVAAQVARRWAGGRQDSLIAIVYPPARLRLIAIESLIAIAIAIVNRNPCYHDYYCYRHYYHHLSLSLSYLEGTKGVPGNGGLE